MGSATMSVQDQSGSTHSNTVLSAGNGTSLGGVQLKEQLSNLSCGNDFAPKVRKPYTITKQREKWTEEEHKKFLEALKLYGRAWRQIEEHVGTKTAVQIRSHAQKFFSKVVRETSADNTNSVEPIEIPPPRPKRKPMHPYPRKLAHSHSLNKETLISEQPVRPTSPDFSVSEPENRSPTSVLSVVGSDAQGSMDSNSRNGSQSPISYALGDHPDGASLSGSPVSEEHGSGSPVPLTADLLPNEHVPVKLELFPKDYVCDNKSPVEEASSTRSLKLFGRTVLVTHSDKPSPIVEDSEEKQVHASLENLMFTQLSPEKMDYAWTHLPQGAPRTLYSMQFQGETSNPMELGSTAALPWSFCGGMPYPFLPFHSTESAREHRNLDTSAREHRIIDTSEGEDKEIQKEGSWTGSNNGSVNDYEEMDAESGRLSVGKEEKDPVSASNFGLSLRSAFSKPKASCKKSGVKGFVPYKRCLAERDMQSSTITSEDREAQRVRLCL